MVDIILKIILLISPLVYALDIPLNQCNIIFFRLSAIALFCAAMFDKPKREIDINSKILIISFLGLAVVSLMSSGFTIIVMSNIISAFLACISLAFIVVYCENPFACGKWAVYAGLVNIGVMILQKWGFNPFLNAGLSEGQEGGLMGNAPRLATLLALLTPFAWRVNKLYAIIFVASCVWLKEYTIIGILVVFLIVRFKKLYRKVSWRIANIILISGLLVFTAIAFYKHTEIVDAFMFRLPLWKSAIEIYAQKPWWGYGFGTLPSVMLNGNIQSVEFIFNSYIQFAYCAGIFAIAWIIYALNIFKQYFKNNCYRFDILALLVLMTIEYPIEIPRLWLIIIALVAFFVIENNKEVTHES